MAFDISEELGSNETVEIEGVWVPLGGDGKVKVARLGNSKTQEAYRKIPRPIRRQLDEGILSNKQTINFLVKFINDHILKGWEGLSDKGKPISYSSETAGQMLRTHRRFRDKIWELSADEALFNVELEEDVKNSPARSSGA